MSCCSDGNKKSQELVEEIEIIDLTLMDDVIEHYGNVKGSLITMLQKIQGIYGYLPKMALNYLSESTDLKEAQIYGVATFYTQFRFAPVGKYLIMLCQGTACYVNGSAVIEKTINEYLKISEGETTEDELFTLNNVACLGCCSLAPVMMVNGETYANLTAEKTVQILKQLKEAAQEAAQ
jgi:NADH-quinone oxidoreductase subunit E